MHNAVLLTVDVGNTNVVVGGFSGGDAPCFVHRLPTRRGWDGAQWRSALEELLAAAGVPPGAVDGSALCSVAPELTPLVEGALASLTNRPVLVVGPELDAGLALVGYDREGLGNDRVVDAVAALAQYPPPLAVFDLGTATTLSVLDGAGRFLGGMILPGLRLSLEALTRGTAQLPTVTPEEPAALLGTDAVSCMRSGAVYGAAAQVDGLTQRVERLLGRPVTTVLTGGLSGLVAPHSLRPVCRDEHLLLKGLRLLYRRNFRA